MCGEGYFDFDQLEEYPFAFGYLSSFGHSLHTTPDRGNPGQVRRDDSFLYGSSGVQGLRILHSWLDECSDFQRIPVQPDLQYDPEHDDYHRASEYRSLYYGNHTPDDPCVWDTDHNGNCAFHSDCASRTIRRP